MLLTLTLTPDAGFQLPEPIHLITSDTPVFLKWLCVYGLDKHQKEVLSSLRRQTNDTPDLSTQTGYTYRILGSIGYVIAAAISGPIVKVGIAQIEYRPASQSTPANMPCPKSDDTLPLSFFANPLNKPSANLRLQSSYDPT